MKKSYLLGAVFVLAGLVLFSCEKESNIQESPPIVLDDGAQKTNPLAIQLSEEDDFAHFVIQNKTMANRYVITRSEASPEEQQAADILFQKESPTEVDLQEALNVLGFQYIEAFELHAIRVAALVNWLNENYPEFMVKPENERIDILAEAILLIYQNHKDSPGLFPDGAPKCPGCPEGIFCPWCPSEAENQNCDLIRPYCKAELLAKMARAEAVRVETEIHCQTLVLASVIPSTGLGAALGTSIEPGLGTGLGAIFGFGLGALIGAFNHTRCYYYAYQTYLASVTLAQVEYRSCCRN